MSIYILILQKKGTTPYTSTASLDLDAKFTSKWCDLFKIVSNYKLYVLVDPVFLNHNLIMQINDFFSFQKAQLFS